MDCFLFQSREFVDRRLPAGGLAGKAAKGLAIAAQWLPSTWAFMCQVSTRGILRHSQHRSGSRNLCAAPEATRVSIAGRSQMRYRTK
jgi:hypothetical protein